MKVIRTDVGEAYHPFNKRARLPYELSTQCPGCGHELKVDMRDQYIIDFRLGDVEVQFYCERCEEYMHEMIVVDVVITPAE